MQSNRKLLCQQWDAIYNSKDSKFLLVGNIEDYKYRCLNDHFLIYNKSLSLKKQNQTQKQANTKQTVFLAFDSTKPNLSNVSNKQILLHINLDEQQIITKQNAHKITEIFFDKEDIDQKEQIQSQAHPILININPIYPYHSLLCMYPDQQLPQIIGSDIVLLLMNIFKVFIDIKVGYNSIGAAASVNHLHFHLFYSQDVIGVPVLPIQKQKRTPWLKSSLINPKEQINLYSVGIKIQEIQSYCYAMVINPLNENQQISEIATSLSYIFGVIINELIELCIPHNVIFMNGGKTIYLILRQFGNEKDNYGWMQFSGIITCTSQQQFNMMKNDENIKQKKKLLLIQSKMIDVVKKNVEKNISQFI